MVLPNVWSAALLFFLSLAAHAAAEEKTLFPPSELRPEREITVTVLLEHSLLENTQAQARRIIQDASEVFSKEFAISLAVVAVKSWDPPPPFHPELPLLEAAGALADAAHLAKQQPSDITVAFTKNVLLVLTPLIDEQGEPTIFIARHALGYSNADKNTSVVALNEDALLRTIHELAHLFYADHTDEISVMNEINHRTDRVKTFDEENRRIIAENRLRSFDKSLIP